jgi:hypothetical protein
MAGAGAGAGAEVVEVGGGMGEMTADMTAVLLAAGHLQGATAGPSRRVADVTAVDLEMPEAAPHVPARLSNFSTVGTNARQCSDSFHKPSPSSSPHSLNLNVTNSLKTFS